MAPAYNVSRGIHLHTGSSGAGFYNQPEEVCQWRSKINWVSSFWACPPPTSPRASCTTLAWCTPGAATSCAFYPQGASAGGRHPGDAASGQPHRRGRTRCRVAGVPRFVQGAGCRNRRQLGHGGSGGICAHPRRSRGGGIPRARICLSRRYAPRKRHAALAPAPPGHRGGERPSQQGRRPDHAGTRAAPHHRAGVPLVNAGRCFSDIDAGNVQVPGTQARAALLLHDRRARQVHLRAVHRMELHQHGNARTTWCPPHRRCTSRFAPRSS